jgi:hypothetical protein
MVDSVPKRRRSRSPRKTRFAWAELPDDELLDVRLCDLSLTLEGTTLERRVEQLYAELRAAGLSFRPYVWLSHEWFTPEESSGFAIPFYLAHPRLMRLEHAQMFEAEGGTHEWCMKLLRHEAAHAFDNAYRMHRRADWRRTFGRYSAPYRNAYRVQPTSKRFVQHLGAWYSQSHPAEDWAETFAVWLAPDADWRTRYADWPALQKLLAVDLMVKDVAEVPQPVRSRDKPDSLPRLRMTLREHYQQRKAAYGKQKPWRFDHELRQLFGDAGSHSRREAAATFLLRELKALRSKVSTLTRQHRYVVDQTIDQMVRRCRELDLRVGRPRSQARLGAAVLATMATLQLARGFKPKYRR